VKCTRGALTITVGDDSRVIPEGSAYRIVLIRQRMRKPRAGLHARSAGKARPPISAGIAGLWFATGAVVLATAIALLTRRWKVLTGHNFAVR
jgi:hypothetical protein